MSKRRRRHDHEVRVQRVGEDPHQIVRGRAAERERHRRARAAVQRDVRRCKAGGLRERGICRGPRRRDDAPRDRAGFARREQLNCRIPQPYQQPIDVGVDRVDLDLRPGAVHAGRYGPCGQRRDVDGGTCIDRGIRVPGVGERCARLCDLAIERLLFGVELGHARLRALERRGGVVAVRLELRLEARGRRGLARRGEDAVARGFILG
jgi:hypothetical protein